METWKEMKARQRKQRCDAAMRIDAAREEVRKWKAYQKHLIAFHKKEKVIWVSRLRDAGLTQTEAARALGVGLTHINNIVKRSGIHWPVRQGSPSRPLSEVLKIVEDAE